MRRIKVKSAVIVHKVNTLCSITNTQRTVAKSGIEIIARSTGQHASRCRFTQRKALRPNFSHRAYKSY